MSGGGIEVTSRREGGSRAEVKRECKQHSERKRLSTKGRETSYRQEGEKARRGCDLPVHPILLHPQRWHRHSIQFFVRVTLGCRRN